MSGATQNQEAGHPVPSAKAAAIRRHSHPAVLPTLIDVETLAQSLGVSVRHVRRLVDERRIPFVKVGRFVRFDVDQVASWVDKNRVDQSRPAMTRAGGR